ncbi:MAG: hypothetical protein Q9195_007792, partial [Heterodermia aff. obscurata]
MTSFDPDTAQLRSLKDKVVVLTGGANGIGAATVNLFAKNGALIVFGDLDVPAGEKLASDHENGRIQFLRTDVTRYEDNVALFRLALKTYGKVDHALSIAGIVEQGNIVDPALNIDDVEKPPTNIVIDVNLVGPLYFVRIAVAYLKHNKQPSDDKSILLFSSVAGFCDSPGLFAYGASKHGVLGLMRCLRHYLPPTFGIRVNAIAPFGTATTMLPEAIAKGFPKIGVPVNTPEQVAGVTLGVVAGTHKGKNGECTARVGLGAEGGPCNGLTIYVESGKGWELEEGLAATRAEWQGEGPNERLLKAMAWLAS